MSQQKKMSKSDKNAKASIYLLDNPDEAYQKIMKAVTDSEGKIYISDEKPGIKNLLTIYSALANISLNEAEKIFANKNYAELKSQTAQLVKDLLIRIQEKYNFYINNVENESKIGAEKAQKFANINLKKLMKGLGLNNESK
nr:hypothetical protein [Metamycoplasma equirhinis]